MDIQLLVVPYDSGNRGARMGAGPERLIEAGLERALREGDHLVRTKLVEVSGDSWHAETQTSFELMRCRRDHHGPLLDAARGDRSRVHSNSGRQGVPDRNARPGFARECAARGVERRCHRAEAPPLEPPPHAQEHPQSRREHVRAPRSRCSRFRGSHQPTPTRSPAD
jgi:hypothetical protein